MNSFIRLSSVVINTNHIHKIVIQENKYHIHLNRDYGMYSGILYIYNKICSNSDEIIICKNTNFADYTVITDWINKRNK